MSVGVEIMNIRMIGCKKCGAKFMTLWEEGTIACPDCGSKDDLVFDKKKPSWSK